MSRVILDKESQEIALGGLISVGSTGVDLFSKLATHLKGIDTNSPSYMNLMDTFRNFEKTFNEAMQKYKQTAEHVKATIELTEKVEKAAYSSVVSSKSLDFGSHVATPDMPLI